MNSKKMDRYFAKKLTDYVEQYIRAIYTYDVRRVKTKGKYSIEIKPTKLCDRFYRPVFNVNYEDAAVRMCNVDAVIRRVKDCISDWHRIDWGKEA
jgi:hypothetical protein